MLDRLRGFENRTAHPQRTGQQLQSSSPFGRTRILRCNQPTCRADVGRPPSAFGALHLDLVRAACSSTPTTPPQRGGRRQPDRGASILDRAQCGRRDKSVSATTRGSNLGVVGDFTLKLRSRDASDLCSSLTRRRPPATSVLLRTRTIRCPSRAVWAAVVELDDRQPLAGVESLSRPSPAPLSGPRHRVTAAHRRHWPPHSLGIYGVRALGGGTAPGLVCVCPQRDARGRLRRWFSTKGALDSRRGDHCRLDRGDFGRARAGARSLRASLERDR
jgi:hypothetical protein